MLKSELYQLEKQIGDILANEQTANSTRPPGNIEEEFRQVQILCNSLMDKWVHELFSAVKEHVIQRYVQFHQAGLTALSNQISRRLEATDGKAPIAALYLNLYQVLLSELENLLSFFKRSFYKYFDLDFRVTIYRCQKNASEYGEIRDELQQKGDLRPELTPLNEVLASSVSDLFEKGITEGISYRQTDHALNLVRTTFQMQYARGDIKPEDLAKSFYKQNLNTLYFFNWYKDFLTKRIKMISGEAGRSAAIHQELVRLESLFVDPAKSLEPDLPPINLMVIRWLQELAAGTENENAAATAKKYSNGQLGLTLSVAQFALFIRVFYQAGCFATTNISRIMRFFTDYFITKKQSRISLKSFSNAFYSSDQSAAAVVRDYLQKMINYIDKTFFP